MAFTFSDEIGGVAGAGSGNAIDILNRNALTTAGVLVAGSTGIASLALVSAALPAQIAAASGVSAGLIYLGDRQYKGLPLNPFAKDEAKPDQKQAEPKPAAEVKPVTNNVGEVVEIASI